MTLGVEPTTEPEAIPEAETPEEPDVDDPDADDGEPEPEGEE